jgi:hypothetical protein
MRKKKPAVAANRREPEPEEAEEHLYRVRRICMELPDVSEKLSHGEPTFFTQKRVFAMFDNNHHHQGRLAVWIPTEPGLQAALIKSSPKTYFRPPYVGVAGWVGIELRQISDDDLSGHIAEAWQFIANKSKKALRKKSARKR